MTTTIKVINLLDEDIQSHVFGDIMKRQVIGELRVPVLSQATGGQQSGAAASCSTELLDRGEQIGAFVVPHLRPQVADLLHARLDRVDREVLRLRALSCTSFHVSGVETPANALPRAL